jgi:arylsulfatase A-like enzyme
MNRRPNVLILLTDQQHTNTLGCYGNGVISTPNVDRLARDGVLFDRHYVTIPLCVPSRASIWSSQYAHTNGVMVNDDGRGVTFPDAIPTLGDVAKSAGYVCGYIGKWHIGRETVLQHGFTDAWWTQLRGSYEQHLEETGGARFDSGANRYAQRAAVPFEAAHDTVVCDRTIEFLKTHRDAPFVCVCSMRAPHDPYIGPFDTLYDPADVPIPPTVGETFSGKPAAQRRGAPRLWFESWIGRDPQNLNLDALRATIARYWGLVHLIDVNVGRVLTALDELALAEDTVVLFMSDHGDQMGNHGLFAKGLFLYDDSTRVPCVLRWKSHLPAGRRVNHLTTTLDIVPTLLDLMGVGQPREMQGESMRQIWDYAHNRRDAVFMEVFEAYGCGSPIFGVRTDRWKYNWHVADVDELYDMREDPYETRNLAPSPEHRDTLLGLRYRVLNWLEETGDVRLSTLVRIPPSAGSG